MSVAMHEAAHAVVGLLLELKLEQLTIVPDGDVLGCALFTPLPDGYPEYEPEYEDLLRGHAISSLAGPCADPEGCQVDYEAAADVAWRVGGSEEGVSRLIEEWTARHTCRSDGC